MVSSAYIFWGVTGKEIHSNEGEKTSGALKAMQYWNDARRGSDNRFPEQGISSEYNKVKLRKRTDDNSTVDADWQAIGPKNIGGRTISIAVNPQNSNTIYAGSASGGLWRSYSAGEGENAWEYVRTGYPVHGVSSITFANGDSSEIYIGTGEVYNLFNTRGGVSVRETRGSYGIGILKSTNGGESWFKSLDWSYEQGRCVWAVKVNPLNRKTVWAGTTNGTYKSTDAGSTWIRVHDTLMVTDLIINPTDTNTVLVACGNLFSTGKGIYKTVDGGTSWRHITSGLPSDYKGKALFAQYKPDPRIIYLSLGNGYWSGAGTRLMRSVDGGETWNTMAATDFSDYRGDYASYQGWFAHFIVVNQQDPNKILAAGVDVFKSRDGGNTLQQKSYWYNWYFGRTTVGGPEGPLNYSHADHHAYAVSPDNPNVVYLATDGGIFRTTDFGESFEGLNGGYQTTQFYNGFSSSFTDSIFSLGGMQDNATAIYDGSDAWVRVIAADGGWTGINMLNNHISYGSWQELKIVKLTRASEGVYLESYIAPPASGTVGFIGPFVVSPSDPQIIYAGRGIVFKSTNSGTNWTATNSSTAITNNPPVSMAISYTNPDVVFVGTAAVNYTSEIFRTVNGGMTWTEIKGELPHSYPMDIEVDPDNDDNVFVVFSGFGNSHAFRSTNKGDEWINIGNGLPDVPATSVTVDPAKPYYVYVGTDLGVFFSPDTGHTWVDMNGDLPDACMVTDLSVSRSNRKLRIATHGSGVFETDMIDEYVVGVEEKESPETFHLSQNYPNPFNPTTTIEYNISSFQHVSLKVYDVLGREVSTLVDTEQNSGSYKVLFDASGLASGIYYYRLTVAGRSATRKLTLIK